MPYINCRCRLLKHYAGDKFSCVKCHRLHKTMPMKKHCCVTLEHYTGDKYICVECCKVYKTKMVKR